MFSSCFFQDSKNERYASSPYQRENEPWTAWTLLPKGKVNKAPFFKSSTYRKPQSSVRMGSGLIKEKRFSCPMLEKQKVFGGVRGGGPLLFAQNALDEGEGFRVGLGK